MGTQRIPPPSCLHRFGSHHEVGTREIRFPARVGSALLPLLLFVSSLHVPTASVASFLPLYQGNTWEYIAPGNVHERRTAVGQIEIWGSPCWVIRYSESTFNEGLENYCTVDEAGCVYLWGAWRPDAGFGILYSPPLRLIDGDPELWETWTSTYTAYLLPDTIEIATGSATFGVYEVGTISVPAGDFFSYGIGYWTEDSRPALPAGSLTDDLDVFLALAPADGNQGNPTKWWSDGVGLVRYLGSSTMELITYDLPTRARRLSWGAVRWNYR